MEPPARRALVASQRFGNLGAAHAEVPVEHDNLALFGGQLFQRRSQPGEFLPAFDRAPRRSHGVEAVLHGTLQPLPAPAVVMRIPRNRDQPRAYGMPVTKRLAMAQHPHENLLHQILARLHLPRHAPEVAEQSLVVPFKENTHQRHVACAHVVHDLFVTGAFGLDQRLAL